MIAVQEWNHTICYFLGKQVNRTWFYPSSNDEVGWIILSLLWHNFSSSQHNLIWIHLLPCFKIWPQGRKVLKLLMKCFSMPKVKDGEAQWQLQQTKSKTRKQPSPQGAHLSLSWLQRSHSARLLEKKENAKKSSSTESQPTLKSDSAHSAKETVFLGIEEHSSHLQLPQPMMSG